MIIVEIKTKPNAADVTDHIKRMKKLRCCADLNGDRRAYLGAIAGVVFGKTIAVRALKSGFYVIEPVGEYRPREW